MADDSAFSTFEQDWFAAHPEFAVADVFLPSAERRVANAFGCLAHELGEAAWHAREPQIAAAKLGWWRDEIAAAASGTAARHPITQQLFAEAAARAIGTEPWLQLADAALAARDIGIAADLPELLRQRGGLHQAIARIEAGLIGAADADVGRNAALWTISHLLRELRYLGPQQEQLPLPLDLLARHGLARTQLAQPGAARDAALRDHLRTLAAAMTAALAVPSTRSLYQGVRIRLDRRLIDGAVNATSPLDFLAVHAVASRWASLWFAWREARRLERARPHHRQVSNSPG